MITDRILASAMLTQHMLQDLDLHRKLEQLAGKMIDAYRLGGKTIFCGNGGSAADAQHLAAELSGKFYLDRPPIPAEACHVNSSFITAVSNDYGYEYAYERYIEAVARPGDVVLALSTSGHSANIIRALRKAGEMGLFRAGFTGAGGGAMPDNTDLLIRVPSEDTPRIQEAHLLLGHILCEMVESRLFGQ